jgi:hypothetical protein
VRLLAPILLVAAVPVLGLMALRHDRETNEHRLGRVASEIAGRHVEVHCPGTIKKFVDISPHAGSVYFDGYGRPADYTELNDPTCSTLDDFAEGEIDRSDALRVARALHVLAHESIHLSGIRDEAQADCFGFQKTAFVAEELGASRGEARRYAELAVIARTQSAPPEYRSRECRDGGALDLNPDSSVWP